MAEHRKAVKEIMTVVEEVDMTPDEYHCIRSKVKAKIFRLMNVWLQFFATVVDAKFFKKINEDGEKEETHLRNGEN
jgi:hypothetical protein